MGGWHIKNIISLLCLASLVLQGDEIDDINLGEVSITANKISTLTSESAGNVSVITKQDINKTPNAKFSDTLRGLEGVNTPKGRGLETFDGVIIRGISGGTNILIDGVSINDMNNNTKMLTSMNALDLERVEVIRGPFSNIYGSGALGGVVNFITQMYDELTIKTSIGYGNPLQDKNAPQNLVRGFVTLGDAYFNGRFKIKASYAFSTSKGYAADEAWASQNNSGVNGYIPTTSSTGSERFIVGDMGRQSYGTHDFRLRGKLDIGNEELDVNFNYSNYNYKHVGQQTFLSKNGQKYWGESSSNNSNDPQGTLPYAFVGGMGNEAYNQFIEAIKYKHYFQDSILEFNISKLDGFDYWNGPNADASPFGGSGKQVFTRHQKNALDLIYSVDLSRNLSFIVGGDYKMLSMDIDNSNVIDWRYLDSKKISFAGKSGGDSHFIGAFGNLNMKFLDDKLIASIGGRADYWIGNNYYNINSDGTGLPTKGNNKLAFSPKLSVNYNLFQTTLLKTSIGKAFRVPTLNQMFSEYTYNDGTKILGNPDLRPEDATSFDIGVEQKIINSPIKIFYFHTTLSNAIYLDNTTKSYQNAGSARLQGVEIAYKEKIYDFIFHITYTLTNSKMLKNNVDQNNVGKKLPGIPEHKVYVNLYYEYNHLYSQDSKLYTSLGYEFASKTYNNADNSDTIKSVYGAKDSYSLFDLRIGMYLNRSFSLNFDITNLLNERYYSYYRAPSRAFFLSFNYNI